jgi:signal transduction histidine kinase
VSTQGPSKSTRKTSRAPALRRIAEQVLETANVEDLARLLTRTVPEALGLDGARLLLWNRKLDDFSFLSEGETQLVSCQPAVPEDPEPEPPQAGFLISDGVLLPTPEPRGTGVLVPLIARSGALGTWMLPAGGGRRGRPFRPAEARLLWSIATRAALAFENHLYQKELIATERMAVLGSMAGMMAHDFRGPMTVIRGYAETLMDGALSEESLKQRAEVIVAAVDRLERMTAETLDFARGGGRLARRRVDVRRLLEEMALGLELELPGLEITQRFEVPAGVRGLLDTDKLRRAVGNVAANARDAMGGRGRLYLGGRLEEGAAPGAEDLVLEVGDQGPGVPEEIRDRLFEPFVTRGKRRGTGLGLAVTKRFVEDHGGTIELLDTAPGATFRIRVPLLKPGEPSGERGG